MINGRRCKILKADGCNTNIISGEFIRRKERYFNVIDRKRCIEHSSEDSSELTNGVAVDAEVRIARHRYRSNWTVVNCWYDVILRTPWNNENKVITDHKAQKLTVNDRLIPITKVSNN